MSSLVSFAACMLSSSCSARARLRAFAWTSSKIRSSFRKSSNLEPVRGLRFATLPLLEAFLSQLDIVVRCLLRLLDERMKQHHLPALNREECPRYAWSAMFEPPRRILASDPPAVCRSAT